MSYSQGLVLIMAICAVVMVMTIGASRLSSPLVVNQLLINYYLRSVPLVHFNFF